MFLLYEKDIRDICEECIFNLQISFLYVLVYETINQTL
jgi:hypothetical protein